MSADFASSLAVLEEPGGLETILLDAGEMPLLAEVKEAAERLGLVPSKFATLAVRRFIARADSEDWASLTSRANARADAMGSVVTAILRKAVGDVKEIVS